MMSRGCWDASWRDEENEETADKVKEIDWDQCIRMYWEDVWNKKEEVIDKVKDLMANAMEINVPMDVDANPGMNWLEAH